ncbi:MAG: Na/Pi cotransporter family protein [Atribacterota bacterium]|jgi:phosphate:Na+ symporter|nr:Na/Pi cotransporter family protein [Atribacterota bacterium]MDD4895635.1 Na/Pi cotransporter family protein [Atribacterota bacterium]MDD5637047.1 Na/Pi cotransporter family protein [Atribacterota bacterium]
MSVIFFNLLGGLALFLYGLFILSDGLKQVFYKELKDILKKITSSTIKAVGFGAFITAIIQSSSITVVTLIGLLNSSMINLVQAIGVMLGAKVGTTITAQIVAFKIGLYYFPFIILGCFLFFFFRHKRLQNLGQIILGFGILFLGMQTMSRGAQAIQEITFFVNILHYFSHNVFLGILTGAIFTAIVQSSSVTTGLVIAMGMEGALTLPVAISLIMGANVGTCITGFLASLGSCKSAKRLAVAQFAVNIVGIPIFAFFLIPFSHLISLTSFDLGRQIANAHTFFNVFLVIAAIPLINWLKILSIKIVPGRVEEVDRGIKFLEYKILNIPSLALLQAQKEVLHMASIAKGMLEKAHKAMFSGDKDLIYTVKIEESSVDELHHILDDYLTKISSQAFSKEESQKLAILIHSVTDIERVADHANNLVEISEFKFQKNIAFSDLAEEELNQLFLKAIDSFAYSIDALETNSEEIAQKTIYLENEIDLMEENMRKNHFDRLKEGICCPESGPMYLEIIMNLERVSNHSENIASGVIMGF